MYELIETVRRFLVNAEFCAFLFQFLENRYMNFWPLADLMHYKRFDILQLSIKTVKNSKIPRVSA